MTNIREKGRKDGKRMRLFMDNWDILTKEQQEWVEGNLKEMMKKGLWVPEWTKKWE